MYLTRWKFTNSPGHLSLPVSPTVDSLSLRTRHCYPEWVFRVYPYLHIHAYLSSTLEFQISSLSFFIYPSIPVKSLPLTCEMATSCCYNNLCGYNIYLRGKRMTFNV